MERDCPELKLQCGLTRDVPGSIMKSTTGEDREEYSAATQQREGARKR